MRSRNELHSFWKGCLAAPSIAAIFLCAQASALSQGAGSVRTLETRSPSVRGIVFPNPSQPNYYSVWGDAIPAGDLNNDGMGDFILRGGDGSGLGTEPGEIPLIYAFGEGREPLQHHTWEWSIHSHLSTTDHYTSLLQKTPLGVAYIAGSRVVPELLVWDSVSGDLLRSIPPPEPPPGFPKVLGFSVAQRAGDINQDGYDDIFFEGRAFGPNYFICGLLDGKTYKAIWQYYYPEFSGSQFTWTNVSHEPSDFNLDGVPDYLGTVVTSPTETTFIAVSGLDGTLIWEYVDDAGYVGIHRRGVGSDDLNGDGVADIVTYFAPERMVPGSGYIRVIDGKNSRLLWSRPYDDFAQLFPASEWDRWLIGEPLFVTTGMTGPASKEVAVHFQVTDDNQWPHWFKGLVYLDATTGDIVDHQFLPVDLAPWTDQKYDFFSGAIGPPQLLGDINRDGFTEIGVTSYFDIPGSTAPNMTMYTIVGQRTLFLPAELAPGETARASIYIPGAAGMDFQVITSLHYSHNNGLKIRQWDTNLAPSNWLNKSLHLPFLGRLDPDGRAQFTFHIPNNPSLLGTDFYCRVLVPHPAIPGDLWTQSSLETLKVR